MFARAAGGAEGLSKSVLGTLALFLLLVYFIGSFTLVVARLDAVSRLMLVSFIVFFPVLVLGVFYQLVTRHFGKVVNPDKVDPRTYAQIVRDQAGIGAEAVAVAVRDDRERRNIAHTIKETGNTNEKETLQQVMDWFSPKWQQKRFIFRNAAEELGKQPELVFSDTNISKDVMDVFAYLDEICEAVTSGLVDEDRIPENFRRSAVRYLRRGQHWITFLRKQSGDERLFIAFETMASNWQARKK